MPKKYLSALFIIGLLLVVGYFVFSSSGQKDQNQSSSGQANINNTIEKEKDYEEPLQSNFIGEKGKTVSLVDGQIILESNIFTNSLARYYNTELPNGKTIYFFVLKDKAGVYRATANACQICFDARMGFRQEGDFMVCNTCGNKYPLAKIATEKGGCNPGPINPNLEVKNNQIIIQQSDLEKVADLF